MIPDAEAQALREALESEYDDTFVPASSLSEVELAQALAQQLRRERLRVVALERKVFSADARIQALENTVAADRIDAHIAACVREIIRLASRPRE